MARILIQNGQVWDGNRFLRADVLTDGETVAKMEEHINDSADFVYDAAGKIVSAGFVDAHVHLRGISSDAFGIHPEAAGFPFGVTAAADASGNKGSRTLMDSFMLKSVTFAESVIRQNRFDAQKTEAHLRLFGDRAVGIKVFFDTTTAEVTDITPLREVCAFASSRNLRVMVHCAHSPCKMADILRTLNPGDILTHAFHGQENNAAEDGFAALREAQARGVIIDVGMAGHVHTDFAILARALREGFVPNLIASDVTCRSLFMRGGRYGMTMCINIARFLGMKTEDILRAVTSNPARALGKSDEWGNLAVGRHADIAVLEETDEGFDLTDASGTHIHSKHGLRCVLTVADGQIVYRN